MSFRGWLFALGTVAVSGLQCAEPADEKIYGSYRFVEDVLLTKELPSNENLCRRFTDSPAVGLILPHGHQEVFEAAVGEINAALAPTKFSLRSVFPATAKPQIKFFYVNSPSQYIWVKRNYGFESPAGEYAWHLRWDEGSRLTEGFAIVSDAGATDEILRYRTLRCLLGVLGFNGTSPAIKESVFSGRPGRLSGTDRCLIRFFYGYVQPGDPAYKIRNAFDRYWNRP